MSDGAVIKKGRSEADRGLVQVVDSGRWKKAVVDECRTDK